MNTHSRLPLKSLLPLLMLTGSLFSCGNLSERSIQTQNQNDNQVEQVQYRVIDVNPVLYSEYGLASLKFNNTVLVEKIVITRSGNFHNKEIFVPHNGTQSVQLTVTVNDGDDNEIYVAIKNNNGRNLVEDPVFGINNNSGEIVQVSGVDTENNDYNNYKMVKVPLTNGQGTLDWKYVKAMEGQVVDMEIDLYNKFDQGSETVLDLRDYFSSFKLHGNTLPNIVIKPTPYCPVNPVDTNNDGTVDRYEIPPNYDCVSIGFTNPGDVGFNPRYSLDGTNFNPIDFDNPVNVNSLNLAQGNTMTKQVWIKEYLDSNNTIVDQTTKTTPTIYKDVRKVGNTELIATYHDNTTGNEWVVNDLGGGEFADPGSNDTAGTITVTGSSATYGTCDVHVRKNGNELYNQTMPCNNINISYTVPASDKGAGWQGMEFKVYKIYKKGPNDTDTQEIFVDNLAVDYKVNKTPTTNP